MYIKDLEKYRGFDNLILKIKEKEPPRNVMGKNNSTQRVSTLLGEDKNKATIKITLWNNDIDGINVGDTVELTDGYCKEYRDELYISTGKNGSITKIKAK